MCDGRLIWAWNWSGSEERWRGWIYLFVFCVLGILLSLVYSLTLSISEITMPFHELNSLISDYINKTSTLQPDLLPLTDSLLPISLSFLPLCHKR